jgi:NTE family protein
MSTAFVLSGGASLAAVQVGMLQALSDAGVRPDMVVGTSAGAFNAAWVAGHPDDASLDQLERIWTSIRREEVFRPDPVHLVGAAFGRGNHLFGASGLRALAERHLAFRRLEEAAIPLHVVATEVVTGRELLISKGPAVNALMASAAIPAIFAPVTVGGRALMDGGVADNTPIKHAVDLDADQIYVLPGGYACALPHPPGSALGMALHALTLLIQQRLISDIERYERYVELVVLPAPCPLSVAPADFRHAADLIAAGRRQAAARLRRPRVHRGQADLLAFHGRHHSRD